ncbi:carbohydrate kinase family protein [bacterium]|nr:carbohydrate kinase family protein [bacterium]
MDIVIAPSGRVYLDLIFLNLARLPHPGEEHFARSFSIVAGGTFNVARALSRLGQRAHLAATLGNDPASELLDILWKREGLPQTLVTRIDAPASAVTASYSLDGDRAFVSYIDEIEADGAGAVLDAVRADMLVLPGVPAHERLLPLVERARAAGIPICLAAQFLGERARSATVAAYIERADTFICNAVEARDITGENDPVRAAAAINARGPRAIVTDGSRGAVLAGGDGTIRVAAPAIEAVDTTGAGDCFVAGFVDGAARGFGASESLRRAVAAGTLTCLGAGGAAAPTREALEEFLVRVPAASVL